MNALAVSVLGILVAGMFLPFLPAVARRWVSLLAAIVPLGAFGWFLLQIPGVAAGVYPEFRADWVPALGIFFSMRLDGLSLLFALLITGVGTLILIYTGGYFHGQQGLARMLACLLFFMGAMLGLVLSDNLILLFLFWELTSISSYLLIGFNHENAIARRNALQALLVTGIGGLALLAGIVLLGISAGTYEASLLPEHSEAILSSPLFPAALAFILLGAFTKSAQFPFHFWLPNAMAAPTPVSAYLHSATMVKAGVFLLARLNPALAESVAWHYSLLAAGGITMLLGAVLGLFQTDLKRILAYTTLSVLGMLIMLLGVGTELALQSAVFFLFGHALYKAALFLCGGNVDHACHTRDVRRLRALRFALPATALAAGLAALSKAGFPPFFGFLGKEYVYKSGVALEELAIPVIAVAFLVNMMLLALAFQAGVHPFFGKKEEARLGAPPHGLPASMWGPPLFLGLLGVVIGLFPGLLILPLVQSAVGAMVGTPVSLTVALWHGFNLPLLLTVLTIAAGLFLYRLRAKLWKASPMVAEFPKYSFDKIYDFLFSGLLKTAKWQTRILQNGKLHNYMATVVAVTTVLLIWKLSAHRALPSRLPDVPVQPLILGVMAMMAISAILAVTTISRLATLATLGLTGYGLAFLFANYGAADLAITQILVETLTIVFFMMVLHHLPKIRELTSIKLRVGDALLAGISGAVVALIVLFSLYLRVDPGISGQLAAWSYAEAYGRNVVNVILVDFRALDTLGEILVLAIASIGVFLLLRAGRLHQSRAKLKKTEEQTT